MKRVGGLYPMVWTRENLSEAFWKASKGKQDHPEVLRFRQCFREETAAIQRQGSDRSLSLGNYRFFKVHDPKPREICAACFRERVIHHAIMNICEPVLESCSIYDSYACRKGKGTQKALKRTQVFLGRNPWFLKLDIHKYFDSIDHGKALAMLGRKIKDKNILALFEQILDTFHISPGKGLPIGNLISQHLANFYLSGFDHWIKEDRKLSYLRYMDDFILFGHDKQRLKQELQRVEVFLDAELALTLHRDRQLNRSEKGVRYLGYRVYPQVILLSSDTRKRMIRRCREYETAIKEEKISQTELIRSMESVIAATRVAAANGFRRALFDRFRVLFQGQEPGAPRRLLCQ